MKKKAFLYNVQTIFALHESGPTGCVGSQLNNPKKNLSEESSFLMKENKH